MEDVDGLKGNISTLKEKINELHTAITDNATDMYSKIA